MNDIFELHDPRTWPARAASPRAAALHAQVEKRLAASETRLTQALDAAIDASLTELVLAGDGEALDATLGSAPSAAVHRHLWRRLAEVERAALRAPTLAVALFALPVVIVAAREGAADKIATAARVDFATGAAGEAARAESDPATTAVTLPATLSASKAVVSLMREHDALRGNVQFTLSNALIAADALAPRALPALIAHARVALEGGDIAPLALPGQPLQVEGMQESVHLRFIVGSAMHGPRAEPFGEDDTGKWGLPLAHAVSRDLARAGVTVLALPRAPQRLVPALASGRAAQRDVALQLFVGNALRRMRASVGEPIAVLSAHRAADAPGEGELRLALSSPFLERAAEGFRYALQPYERVPDAVASIVTLLRDCRVRDVRALAGIQPDRDAATGVRRFGLPDEAGTPRATH